VRFLGVFGWFDSLVQPAINKELPFHARGAQGCQGISFGKGFHDVPDSLYRWHLFFTKISICLPTFCWVLGTSSTATPGVVTNWCVFFSASHYKTYVFPHFFSLSVSLSYPFEILHSTSYSLSWLHTSWDSHQSAPWLEFERGKDQIHYDF
jgi:hypothetical protein